MSTAIPPEHRAFGLVKQQPDARDYQLASVLPTMSLGNLPPSYNLRPHVPWVDDQGSIGTCVEHATTMAVNLARIVMQKQPPIKPSISFTYKYARLRDGIVGDGGSTARSAAKSLGNEGLCPAWAWPDGKAMLEIVPGAWWKQNLAPWMKPPYSLPLVTPVGTYTITQDPTYVAAHHHELGYYAVSQDIAAIKTALAAGRAVEMGFEVKSNFLAINNSGIMGLPAATDAHVGWHSVLITGYDDNMVDGNYTGFFCVLNSWGTGFGDSGYFWMPFEYFTSTDPAVVRPFDLWSWGKAA